MAKDTFIPKNTKSGRTSLELPFDTKKSDLPFYVGKTDAVSPEKFIMIRDEQRAKT